MEAWRASGKTAAEFVAGKGFAEGTLRHWAWRLRKTAAAPSETPAGFVRLVTRGGASAPSPGVSSATGATGEVTVELCGGRVTVAPGFDRATLREVLEVLRETAP